MLNRAGLILTNYARVVEAARSIEGLPFYMGTKFKSVVIGALIPDT